MARRARARERERERERENENNNTIRLQIAQSRPYVCTLGAQNRFLHILGALRVVIGILFRNSWRAIIKKVPNDKEAAGSAATSQPCEGFMR